MFRLFLRKKLLAGDGVARPKQDPAKAQQRDRRVFARFNMDHKHLTLMNEQDILLVREISAKGFSTEVSPRGFERLAIGDVYDARIRYLGEVYDLTARVVWKSDNFVGFEIEKAARETLNFIKRLLRPVEIACSLQPVEAAFMHDQASGKQWFHGEQDTDLYIWSDTETNEITTWQLASGEAYVEWNEAIGLSTGSLVAAQGARSVLGTDLHSSTQTPDQKPDSDKRQFAIDIIMALPFPVRDDLLETILK